MSIALVVGGGACVWSDVRLALELGEFDAVVACNDAAAAWPGRLDAAVSLHAEKWGFWMERRRLAGRPLPDLIIGHAEAKRGVVPMPSCVTGYVEHRFPGQKDTGSSGLFALKFALVDLGIDRAVLCGVPMTAEQNHFFDERRWGGATSHRRGWKQALPQIADRARSMSGWTAELLGKPTSDWLAA